MSWLTDEEQSKLLPDTSTTGRIKKWMVGFFQEMNILGKIDATADEVRKVWEVAKKMDERQDRIERRQKKRTEADIRSWKAHVSTLESQSKD